MALVKETGSVVSGANTFVDLDDFEDYFDVRNETSMLYDYTDTQKEASLIRAADYLNGKAWKGAKTEWDQPMCFPRDDLYDEDNLEVDNDCVPDGVKNAQLEAAKIDIQDNGALQADKARGGKIKRKKTDVLETEYFSGAPGGTLRVKVDGFLLGYLRSTASRSIMRS